MSKRDDLDLSDWEQIDPLQPAQPPSCSSKTTARQSLASTTSALLHSKGPSRRPSTLSSRQQQTAGHFPAPQRSPRIWIVGILALSAFWCFVSLLAISRLEKRLPSEMQDQLEFHTAFSGLWPKAQGATAGLNATNATMHHLPFAEASLSHKHRKRMGSGAELEDGAATDYSAAAAEGDLFVQKPPASAEQQVEEAGGWGLLEPAMSSFKHAFAVEESHRGFMRGLKSIL